jgi:hypothetical protein
VALEQFSVALDVLRLLRSTLRLVQNKAGVQLWVDWYDSLSSLVRKKKKLMFLTFCFTHIFFFFQLEDMESAILQASSSLSSIEPDDEEREVRTLFH